MITETPEQTACILLDKVHEHIIRCFGKDSRQMTQFALEWAHAANWKVRASVCVGWLTYLVDVEDAEHERWGK